MSDQCAVCDASRLRSELMDVKGERTRLRAETAALAAKVKELEVTDAVAGQALVLLTKRANTAEAARRDETAAHQATKQERDRLREALRVMWMEFGGKAATALVPGDLIEVRAALSATPAEATLAVPVLPIDAKAEARLERLLRKTPAEAKERCSFHEDAHACALRKGHSGACDHRAKEQP